MSASGSADGGWSSRGRWSRGGGGWGAGGEGYELRRGGHQTGRTWNATNHTLFTASPITRRFLTARKDVTYTPTSRNATPTSRSSKSNART